MIQCYAPDQIVTAEKMNELGLLRDKDIAYMSYFISQIEHNDYQSYAEVVRKYSVQRQIDYLNKQGKTDRIAELVGGKQIRTVEL
jgi:hypothetical protein